MAYCPDSLHKIVDALQSLDGTVHVTLHMTDGTKQFISGNYNDVRQELTELESDAAVCSRIETSDIRNDPSTPAGTLCHFVGEGSG
jgi:hypothetical protein